MSLLHAGRSKRQLASVLVFGALACACSLPWDDQVEPRASDPVALIAADLHSLGPSLWLSAARDVMVDDEDRVLSWLDRSEHAMDATCEDPARCPLLIMDGPARPLLHFDGDDELVLPELRPLTELSFFAVSSVEENDRTCPSLLHFSNQVSDKIQAHDIEFGRHDRELYYESAVQAVPKDVSHTDSFSVGSLHVLSVIHSPELVVTTNVDGKEAHRRAQMVAPERVVRMVNSIGDNHYYARGARFCQPYLGSIAEILFFSHAVSASERVAIERYLGERWEVTLK